MDRLSISMIDPRILDALDEILTRLEGSPVLWALTGSLGQALQGLPLRPNDIDLQTDSTGVYQIEKRFPDCVISRVRFKSRENIRSHFGKLRIKGVLVDIFGDMEKRLPDGSWTPPPSLDEHRVFIRTKGWQVPALSLRYEAQAYEQMGRLERARMIQDWLSRQA